MTQYHIAQLNIASMKAAIDDPLMKEFVDNLDNINSLAESSPGYIWRLQGDDGNATSIRVFDDDRLLVNYSVWESVESLKNFVYGTQHAEFLRRKKEWFKRFDSAYLVLWWTRAGNIPDLEEAKRRLIYLQEHGDSPGAFTFRKIYQPEPASLELPVE